MKKVVAFRLPLHKLMGVCTRIKVAVDGMCIDLVPLEEEGRLNAYMSFGKAIGGAVTSAMTSVTSDTRPLVHTPFSSLPFWGFLFLLPWTHFKSYYGSVLPNWIENISIYLSMSLVVPLLAFLVNYIKTIQSKEVDAEGSLNLLNFSVILFSITTIFHMISSFENLVIYEI